jgi:EAL domain-containing protein (putative c-di-GMP-specific phosphodiesterase class I)
VPGRHHRARAARSWSQRIRDALAEDRLVLHGQPILELASGRIAQIELLVRMREPDGELVYPGAFLPAAERFDLVQDIDRWVASEPDRRIVRAISDVGHSPGVETIAEFVGDAETLDFLLGCGVDYVQGYHISRPLPLTHLFAFGL